MAFPPTCSAIPFNSLIPTGRPTALSVPKILFAVCLLACLLLYPNIRFCQLPIRTFFSSIWAVLAGVMCFFFFCSFFFSFHVRALYSVRTLVRLNECIVYKCVCVCTYLVCYIVFTFTTINASEALFTSLHTHSHSHASIHLKQVNDKWVSIKENDSNFSSLFEFAGCQLSLIGIWHGLGGSCNGNYRSADLWALCIHTSRPKHTHTQKSIRLKRNKKQKSYFYFLVLFCAIEMCNSWNLLFFLVFFSIALICRIDEHNLILFDVIWYRFSSCTN